MPALNGPLELGLRVVGLTQTAALAAVGAARGLASLPSLAATLDELAQRAAVLDRLVDGLDPLERLADGTASIRRIAETLPLLDDLLASTQSLQPLAAAVAELNAAVAKLNATVSPLQGTAERLGRLVDRFPASRRRSQEPVASPFTQTEDV